MPRNGSSLRGFLPLALALAPSSLIGPMCLLPSFSCSTWQQRMLTAQLDSLKSDFPSERKMTNEVSTPVDEHITKMTWWCNFLPEDKEKDVLEIIVFHVFVPFPPSSDHSCHSELLKRSRNRCRCWVVALVCVRDKVILVSAQDMLFFLRGVIPGTFYRLLTDILEIGCDTLNDISWGESYTDTHLEK